MGVANNGRVQLWYDERGTGDPILLIMGYAARAAHWGEEFRDLLAAGHRVISLDNRGTGGSDKPAEPWSMRDMADDSAAVLEAAGAPPAHVIGLSMGGMIAQELALSHADRVRTLTLVATHSGGPDVVPPTEAAQKALIDPDRRLPAKQLLENIWRTVCAPSFFVEPGRIDQCLRLDLDDPIPLAMLANQMGAVQASDRSQRLPRIQTPTLVITGTEDPLVPPGNADRLVSLIPGAGLVGIPDCGHMVPLEKPRELAQAILPFLAENG